MLTSIENDTKDGTLNSLQYMVTRIRLIPVIRRPVGIALFAYDL